MKNAWKGVRSGVSSKREDLQGIRGIAIISVLGFHFYPSIFPNGYLGVDQFFVLSGFLMCMLLKRTESDPISTLILNFYTKRFRRILPLYFLVIFLILVALYSVFPETAIENNLSSAANALLFVSNRPKTAEEDYFQMMGIASDLFTHTWSLSVEIQFYFIVPIIFIIGSYFSSHMAYYAIIGLASFTFYSISNESVSFNSVFARIWQFVIGMVVYFYALNTKPSPSYKPLGIRELGIAPKKLLDDDAQSTSRFNLQARFVSIAQYVLFAAIVCISNCPVLMPSVITRLLVTMSTGALMCISDGNMVLSNKMLAYIGDFSYSLYLIHWPIYTYWKLIYQNDNSALFFCLLASVFLAILSYEFFEKRTSMQIFTIVVALLTANAFILNKDAIIYNLSVRPEVHHNLTQVVGLPENLTIDDAAYYNHLWTINDMTNLMVPNCIYERKGPLGWCNYTGLDARSKYKLFFFGNSWTANHAKLLFDECRDTAHTIVQSSAYGCEPLYPTVNVIECEREIQVFRKRIAEEQPDYAFLISRFITVGDPIPSNVTNLGTDDYIYQVMLDNVRFYADNTKKKLFILDAVPRINPFEIPNIVPNLKSNMDPAEIDRRLVNEVDYEACRKRFAQLFNDCGDKCQQIDYQPEFFNNATNTFRYFDELGIVYFTGLNHLSPHGLERVRHLYHDICQQL
ncbi:unnamed protein product [Caenorhabditis bovis]|uniref:Acyl_transf_3 domain-containing protein n=1 Tax=Caenorhabditis bovis TaxID=2654633 RepID=A0A8S1F9V2_9PELO|nr:unnamed protein product [Caenorhabditis bovis]